MAEKKVMWYDTDLMWAWIFNVGTGFAAAVRTPANDLICIDCGCSVDFKPTKFIRDNMYLHVKSYRSPFEGGRDTCRKVAQLLISHPHLDHISDVSEYLSKNPQTAFNNYRLYPYYLTCPYSKNKGSDDEIDYNRFDEKALEETAFEIYRKNIESSFRRPPLKAIPPDLRYEGLDFDIGLYYLKPGFCSRLFEERNQNNDFQYINSLSLLYYFRFGECNILFTGDVTPRALVDIVNDNKGVEKRYVIYEEGPSARNGVWFSENADQPSLEDILVQYGLTALVAPHHGSAANLPVPIYDVLEEPPRIILVSQEIKKGEKPGEISAAYSNDKYSRGHDVYIEGVRDKARRMVSTRRGHILLIFNGERVVIKQASSDNIDYLLYTQTNML